MATREERAIERALDVIDIVVLNEVGPAVAGVWEPVGLGYRTTFVAWANTACDLAIEAAAGDAFADVGGEG